MVFFDFKSDKHFVTSSDETAIRVCELSDPTIHPSYIRKTHWKEVGTIIILDSDDNGDDKDLAEEQYYDGLLFFDGHGKIEGQEALTKLARHLTRSGLIVNPGGYCFQDVTELGEHRDSEAHYLRLNDLFSWANHGIELVRITMWSRLELKYTVSRKKKISKQLMVGGGVSKEKYEELKRMLSKKDEELEKVTNEMEDEIQKLTEKKEEELQKLREEMEETIEKKDAELRKVKRQRDEAKRPKPMMSEGVSKEKYEGLKRMAREKDEELEKLREESEEDLQKLRDEKDGEIRKLKEEMEDASEKHEEELRKSRKEKDEVQKQLKRNDGVQQTLKRASDDLQNLRKEKVEELRKLREEMQEKIEMGRKEKDEEIEALQRETKEGAKSSKEQDEELKKLREEVETLRRTRDDEAGKAAKKEEEMAKVLESERKNKDESLQRLINEKDAELEKLKKEQEETTKENAAETRRLSDQLEQLELEQRRKQSWAHPPTTQYTNDWVVHKSKRRAVPPNTWSTGSMKSVYYYENNMTADFTGFFQGNISVQVVDEDTKDWPAPPRIDICFMSNESFDRSNWWFVKISHPDGGDIMLAYYDGDESYTPGFRGYPTRLPIRRVSVMLTNTIFFMIYLNGEFKLAFMYRD
ncbi:unnamed protein product [Linum tenue]|uniref:Uncharacterized protein n=1 Tax=Linum tenue TaxID=586396 RepID=A0AAV0RAX0_9ROSI|nr:unnamed protein product [Linum tenue]